jgi:porphobilinogen synthase
MTVPYFRPRRLRDSHLLREALAETHVALRHLMLPLFVADIPKSRDIKGMPDVQQHPIAKLVDEVGELSHLGVTSFILFGIPDAKDSNGKGAVDDNGVVPRAVRALKEAYSDRVFICTDVCVCAYTDHGHCGVMRGERIDNDASIEVLARMALTHARAGADMVAPSDMMDGRVRRLREVLDAEQLSHVPIMSYAVKYASGLYGPFRHAQDSIPKVGDRRGYQMDVRNRKEALREALLDVDEGADLLMVKPGIAYLDILRDLSEATTAPLAAYQVSGEYAMLKYGALAGSIDEQRVVHELWIAMRRAGASIILTYHAAQAARNAWIER